MVGNRMDTTNLATLFAPNLMHTFKDDPAVGVGVGAGIGAAISSHNKPAAAATSDVLMTQSAASHSDHVAALRLLIEKRDILFELPSVELHDVYLYLHDHFPEVLDALLRRRSALAGFE